jgi:hypothetical protein
MKLITHHLVCRLITCGALLPLPIRYVELCLSKGTTFLLACWSVRLPQSPHLLLHIYIKLITRSRIFLEKLIVTQLIKKLSAYYGTRRFITVFTRARYWPLSIYGKEFRDLYRSPVLQSPDITLSWSCKSEGETINEYRNLVRNL